MEPVMWPAPLAVLVLAMAHDAGPYGAACRRGSRMVVTSDSTISPR